VDVHPATVPTLVGVGLLIAIAALAHEEPLPSRVPNTPAFGRLPPVPPYPAPVPPSARILEITAPNVTVAPQTRYLAKIQLTGFESAFGTANAVKDKLHEIGFNPVTVYAKNPPDIFPDRAEYDHGSTYWAVGDWQGPHESLPMPDQVKRVWVMA
jgi:hypothetical protein